MSNLHQILVIREGSSTLGSLDPLQFQNSTKIVEVEAHDVKLLKKVMMSQTFQLTIIYGLKEINQGVLSNIKRYCENHYIAVISVDCVDMVQEQVDYYFNTKHEDPDNLLKIITVLCRTTRNIQIKNSQNNARVELLTCLTKISKQDQTIDSLISTIAQAISNVCSTSSFRVLDNKGETVISFNLDDFLLSNITEKELSDRKVQIDLKPEQEKYGTIRFPVLCFDNILFLIECYILKEDFNKVTVDTINIVEQTCLQLKLLLEKIENQVTLKQQFDELQVTHNQLEQTQQKLYQSEKIAAMGQLAAGLAHEINNPLAFVINNFKPLEQYAQSLIQCYQVYNNVIKNHIQCEDTFKEIKKQTPQENKMKFISEDLAQLISESNTGLERIRGIIDNFRDFARTDMHQALADVNTALETTFKVLNHSLKDKVTLTKELGDIPEIKCNIGMLNQVFLNILQNASHAIKESGEITVKTWHEHQDVFVSIRDNGDGIPEDVLPKIFDPFFTTKDVGKGTGLGLSVSHSIIQKHQGQIEVDSVPGSHTLFTLKLPVEGSQLEKPQ